MLSVVGKIVQQNLPKMLFEIRREQIKNVPRHYLLTSIWNELNGLEICIDNGPNKDTHPSQNNNHLELYQWRNWHNATLNLQNSKSEVTTDNRSNDKTKSQEKDLNDFENQAVMEYLTLINKHLK